MEIAFTKMRSLGTDFILIDSRTGDFDKQPAMNVLASRLCDRYYGIGADGLILLCSSPVADFKIRIFHANGRELEACDNAIRCLSKYVWQRGIVAKPVLRIDSPGGTMRAEQSGKLIRVDAGEPAFEYGKIPVALKVPSPIVDYPIVAGGRQFLVTCLSLRAPYAIVFVNDGDIDDFPVSLYAPALSTDAFFPETVNVIFVSILNRKELKVKVWEREAGDTATCGTGAAAAAVAAIQKGVTERVVTVHLPAESGIVEWQKGDHVYVTGPATEVFEGRIDYAAESRKEHRRHHRKNSSTELEFFRKGESKEKAVPCICLDISESGIGIISDVELVTGEIVVFKKKGSSTLFRSAVVVWSTMSKNKNKAGLMFI